MPGKIKSYITSFRLRTLPLSLSGIFLGSLLAGKDGFFQPAIFVWAISTTLCLQILSNLANEWGDLQKGTDNTERIGPIRSIQSGALSLTEFKCLLFSFVFLSVLSGSALVYTAFHGFFNKDSLAMLAGGGTAIVAALKYTVGKNAYGYHGWGDLSVFLFFGLLSVAGSYFLMAHTFIPSVLLPASAIGFLSAGVLNLNNMRDIDNDKACGKRTLPVLMGLHRAKAYHFILVTGAFLCMGIYAGIQETAPGNYLFLLPLPLFILHLKKVARSQGRALDPQLKILSLSTLLFAVLSGIGR